MIDPPPTLTRVAVAAFVAALAITSTVQVSAWAQSEEVVLDLTPSSPVGPDTAPVNFDIGWQFAPNEDAELSSVTIWQNGSPNTSTVTIYENNGDTLGPSLGTFTYEPASSDTTRVATKGGIDYFAFTYRGSAPVDASGQYWLVVTPGATSTRLVGSFTNDLQYAANTPGRAVLTGNNLYEADVPWYINFQGSWIYVLRKSVPSPAESAGSSGAEPAIRTVAFALPAGMTCTSLTVTSAGSWMPLPAASDCSFAGGLENDNEPQLLGWANTPDFPVSIAQRQIDKGWGAYEMTDGDGAVTSVFIPAGGAAQITGDARFFPVFAD